ANFMRTACEMTLLPSIQVKAKVPLQSGSVKNLGVQTPRARVASGRADNAGSRARRFAAPGSILAIGLRRLARRRRDRRITVLPPIGKQRRYPALRLTVIHAIERGAPAGRKRIEWKLITNLPVTTRRQAVEKLDWYALRWKIEVFHKILKSGCKAEDSMLRTADRLANLIAVFCVLLADDGASSHPTSTGRNRINAARNRAARSVGQRYREDINCRASYPVHHQTRPIGRLSGTR
ncbi:hypothetical protein PO002_45695, partial [Cupriavidus necator]